MSYLKNITIKSGDSDITANVGENGVEVDVKAITFPTEYPLPAAQITTLTPPSAIIGFATSAKQLPDNHQVAVSNFPASQPVSASALPLPTGAATSAKQDSQVALETTLNSLIETLQELTSRLAPLASAMNAGNPSLRVTPIASVSTAVTGPITSANSIAEKSLSGIGYTMRLAQENLTAIQSNINNCVG